MTGLVVLPTILVLFIACIAGLYWCFRTRQHRGTLVRTAVYTGCILGILRAGLASIGWYVVEHTGGPLQVPAFALAMLAWPEAIVFAERRTTPAPPEFYLRLSLLLFASTAALIGMIATIAMLRRSADRPGPST